MTAMRSACGLEPPVGRRAPASWPVSAAASASSHSASQFALDGHEGALVLDEPGHRLASTVVPAAGRVDDRQGPEVGAGHRRSLGHVDEPRDVEGLVADLAHRPRAGPARAGARSGPRPGRRGRGRLGLAADLVPARPAMLASPARQSGTHQE